jgi:hypothetical protein
MRLQTQRRTLETEGHRYWRVGRRWNTDLLIIVFGSIFGFGVLIALMVYFSSTSQH